MEEGSRLTRHLSAKSVNIIFATCEVILCKIHSLGEHVHTKKKWLVIVRLAICLKMTWCVCVKVLLAVDEVDVEENSHEKEIEVAI